MLVLTRKEGERVRILTRSGEVIWVELIRVDNQKAQLGFDAAWNVSIFREELLEEKNRRPQ